MALLHKKFYFYHEEINLNLQSGLIFIKDFVLLTKINTIMKKQTYQLIPVRLFISGLMIILCISLTQAQDLPEHWESVDIGDVAADGSATFDDNIFTINGSGADIYGTVDAFHFAYQPAVGDCEISAFVSSVSVTAPDAKACLMIRETLDAGSPFAMAVVCAEFGSYLQFRTAADGPSANLNLDHGQSNPVWLKLWREGNTFKANHSTDGETWLLPVQENADSTEVVMTADTVYIGLGVCAHNNDGSLCEAVFENVVVDPGIEYVGTNKLTVSEISLYPNPVHDKLKLTLNGNFSGDTRLAIYNSVGGMVMKESFRGSVHILDIESLPRGVYYITITSGSRNNITRKIIKH